MKIAKYSIISALVSSLCMAVPPTVYAEKGKTGGASGTFYQPEVVKEKTTPQQPVRKKLPLQLSKKEAQQLRKARQNRQIRRQNADALKKLYASQQQIHEDVEAAKRAKNYIERCANTYEACVREQQIKLYQETIETKRSIGADTRMEEEAIKELQGGQK